MPRPDPAAIEAIATLCACRNVRRAARAVTGLYDRILAPTGLRATQVTLLVALEKAGPIPFTRLAGVLGMDRTTLTRNLEPLRRAGSSRCAPARTAACGWPRSLRKAGGRSAPRSRSGSRRSGRSPTGWGAGGGTRCGAISNG